MRLCAIKSEVYSGKCVVKSGNFSPKILLLCVNQKSITFPLHPLLLLLSGSDLSQHIY